MDIIVTPCGQMNYVNENLYVIDPCYLFDNDNAEHSRLWQEFCSVMYPDDAPNGGPLAGCGLLTVVLDDGSKVEMFYSQTAHGDGRYPAWGLGGGGYFSVDAGMYCVVRMEDAQKMSTDNLTTDLCAKFIGVTGTVTVERAQGEPTGNMYGVIDVDTRGATDEDEDEEDYSSYEDEEEYV